MPRLQSNYIHIVQYHNVCPRAGIGTPPHPPLSQASVPRPRNQAGEGVGESQFQRPDKKLTTLSILCVPGPR
jgi:hypothetical protein